MFKNWFNKVFSFKKKEVESSITENEYQLLLRDIKETNEKILDLDGDAYYIKEAIKKDDPKILDNCKDKSYSSSLYYKSQDNIKKLDSLSVKEQLKFSSIAMSNMKTERENRVSNFSDYEKELYELYTEYRWLDDITEEEYLVFNERLYEVKLKHDQLSDDKEFNKFKKMTTPEYKPAKVLNYSMDFIDYVKKNKKNDLTFLRNKIPNFYEEMNLISKKIEQAPKFILPNTGQLIDLPIKDSEGCRAFKPYIKHFKLPYPKVVFEVPYERIFDKSGEVSRFPLIILCEQISDELIEYQVFLKVNNLAWVKLTSSPFKLYSFRRPYLDKEKAYFDDLKCEKTEALIMATFQMVSRDSAKMIYEFLAITNCSNTLISEDIVRSKFINKSRIKKGKTPFFDYKVLTLDFNNIGKPIDQNATSSTGSSKRSHLRRGHIRRLKDKTIWVNGSFVRGNGGGAINKSYLVKPSK